MNLPIKKKQRGIGLLELMLSLSIIAILLVMAVRYYTAASSSSKINNAISQINGIAGAVSNYATVYPGLTNLSIQSLIASNYLPSSLGGSDGTGTGANPWGGNISVAAPGTIGSSFTVTLTGVPSNDATGNGVSTCEKLATVMQNFANTTNSAKCTSGTVAVGFS